MLDTSRDPNAASSLMSHLRWEEGWKGIVVTGLEEKYQDDAALVLPEGLTRVGGSAFSSCSTMKDITRPKQGRTQEIPKMRSQKLFPVVQWGDKRITMNKGRIR